jgi:nicotinamidase-related amidase
MPDGKNTALVVIDVQCGILDDPQLARKGQTERALTETVTRIAELIRRARSASVPVLYVQHDGSPGHRLAPGTPGWPIRPEIAPQPDEPIVHKSACDSFFGTTLQEELAARRIEQLVIAGCMTQYCIDTTVRRTVSLGYDAILVSDGHMTADTSSLRFEQIIAHHNALLDGFDAGVHRVSVRESSKILL